MKGLKKPKLGVSDNYTDKLTQHVLSSNYALTLLKNWYSIGSDGKISLDFIKKRAMYDADSRDENLAKTTIRGNVRILDQGMVGLIDNSHLLFFEFSNIENVPVENSDSYIKAIANVYLYKFNYNEELDAAFNQAIENEKFSEVKFLENLKLIESEPFTFIVKVSLNVDSKASIINRLNKQEEESTTKSDQEKIDDLVAETVDKSLFKISRAYENFKAKQYLTKSEDGKWIAELGKKEGLRADQRFFAYKYGGGKLDDEGNIIGGKFIRKGVLRVKRIKEDNQNKENASFYQVAGGRIDQGYLIQQAEDYGIDFRLGYSFGEIGGASGKISYNATQLLSKHIKFPVNSLKAWLEVGFQPKEYSVDNEGISLGGSSSEGADKFTFIRFTFGISKDLVFAKNFKLTPFIGYGGETVSWKDKPVGYSITTGILDAGTEFSVNIIHNIQVVAYGRYFLPTGMVNYTANDISVDVPLNWSEVFEGRKGVSAGLGIRVQL